MRRMGSLDRMVPSKLPAWLNQRSRLVSSTPKPLWVITNSPPSSKSMIVSRSSEGLGLRMLRRIHPAGSARWPDARWSAVTMADERVPYFARAD
jgi:hypothetical protein